jgi:amphi-Trp domain-containing protein
VGASEERDMADVKLEHKVTLTRQGAARWLADLASALADDGTVTLDLSGSTVKLAVPHHVRCEAEVEVEGDEVELELELKWSTTHASHPVPEPATSSETATPLPAPSAQV